VLPGPILASLAVYAALCCLPAFAQDAQASPADAAQVSNTPATTTATPPAPPASAPAAAPSQPPIAPSTLPRPTGSITGIVTDPDNALVAGAHVVLTSEGFPDQRTAVTDNAGEFTFSGIAAGNFTLSVTSEGLAAGVATGTLHAGEVLQLPQIILVLASAVTDVDVVLSRQDVAEIEVKAEEKQRLAGFLPNFFIAYNWNAPALDAKQKYELAWRTIVDPASFLFTGAIAGIQQATNSFSGYGEGAQGYAKRYAAGYSDFAVGTVLGGAILPSLLHQDPRYFYKGTGTVKSRALYAMAAAFICKGDNGRWQPNYSSIAGNLAAGAISNLYYPSSDRHGWDLTLENGLLSNVFDGLSNVVQELFLSRITTKAHPPASQP
jgi:hypothetical protein